MNFFKIPIEYTKEDDNFFIGLVDASGSMLDNWERLTYHYNKNLPKNSLTITFDCKSRISKKLNKDIMEHGGGSTNLIVGFKTLEQEIKKIDKNKKLTILFISDSEDNKYIDFTERFLSLRGNEEKRKINFLILGLKKNFDVELSMNLKNLYQNGDPSVANYFRIEDINEKTLIQMFYKISPFFIFKKTIPNKENFSIFPYEKIISENIFTGTWVYENNDKTENNNLFFIKGIYNNFLRWNQNLNSKKILKMDNLIEDAVKTKTALIKILENLKTERDIDFLQEELVFNVLENTDFYNIVYNNYIKNYYQKIKNILNNIEQIIESNIYYNNNKNEAIKMITQKKKQFFKNSKKIKLSNMIFIQSKKIKIDFNNIYNANKILEKKSDNKNLSILIEKNFLDSFRYFSNPYELCRSFPLYGLNTHIRKNEIIEIFPWSLKIKFLLLGSSSYLDILKNYGNLIHVSRKNKYYINSVLPLFNKKDSDFKPIINSDFYQLIISNNITKKSSIKVEESYLAFLANVLIYLLNKKFNKTKNKNEIDYIEDEKIDCLLAQIYETVCIVQEYSNNYLNFKNMFVDNIYKTFTDDIDYNLENFKIFEMSKSILVLYTLFKENKIEIEKIKKFLDLCIYTYFLKAESVRVDKLFDLDFYYEENAVLLKNTLKEKMRNEFKDLRTLKCLKNRLEILYLEYLKKADVKLSLNKEKMKKFYKDQIQPLFLMNLYKFMTNEDFAEERLVKLMCLSKIKLSYSELLYLEDFKLDALQEKGYQKLKIKSIFNHVYPKRKIISLKKASSGGNHKYRKIVNKRLKNNNFDEDNENEEEEKNVLIEIINYKLFLNSNFISLRKEIMKEFQLYFRNLHKYILPISFKDMENEINNNVLMKKKFKKHPLHLNTENYLISNACMSKLCKFYLKPTKTLYHHYNVWDNYLPKGFHINVKENFSKSTEEIYQEYIKMHINEELNFVPEDYFTTKIELIKYIELLKKSYTTILENKN